MKKIHTSLSLGLILILTGCSTIYERTSLSGSAPKQPYPATRNDFSAIKSSLDPDSRTGDHWNGGRKMRLDERILGFLFFTLDIPISIISDTVFLPIDLINGKDTKAQQ
ncbi:YceK/YidQ family lipoprotein [Kiritimatiellota bacterium B12222]|nr:YceK/YidQ family lipoprotein [Kiritimatiellota bacterium B12222]